MPPSQAQPLRTQSSDLTSSRMCLQTHPTFTQDSAPVARARSPSPMFLQGQVSVSGPVSWQAPGWVFRGALPSLTYLYERSLIIQLPPKQVQLLLLELLLAAHHMYHHAAVGTGTWGHGLWGRTVTAGTQNTCFARGLQGVGSVTHQASGTYLRPVQQCCPQLSQHGEQILSHCKGNTQAGTSQECRGPGLSGPK